MAGGKCSVCAHAQREQAEALIATGVSVREAAKSTGISYSSLDRHQRNCARQAIALATETREVALGARIVDRVESLYELQMELYREARSGRKLKTPDDRDVVIPPNPTEARLALAGALKNLELQARLRGELDPTEEGERRGITFSDLERIIFERRRTTEVRP